MITLCKACGTSYEFLDAPSECCRICADERQYVPVVGQQWIEWPTLIATHTNKWKQFQDNIFSITTVPEFAINQRAFILKTANGNILWDCLAVLDDATKMLISSLGGLKAIAISHPHFYTSMQEWAAEFNAPVYLHSSDRQWVMRSSQYITFWDGDSLQLAPDVRLIHLGGHFSGGSVLHWDQGDGILFSGDIVQVTPGRKNVSFMWSYPNLLPLPAETVRGIMNRLSIVKYSQIYGAFEGREITEHADDIVQFSGHKYIDCLK